MTKLLMTILMTLTSLASAQVFRTVMPIGLDLVHQREVPVAEADVVVGPKTIEAPGGVRCGGGEFAPRVVTLLERECEVRLGLGQKRSISVSFQGDMLAITLRPPADAEPKLGGEFTQRSLKVDGRESPANFGSLRLLENGRYTIGNAAGRWRQNGASIVFDGPIAHWQVTVMVDGGLAFSFLRGPLEYSIVYTRVSSEGQTAAR